MAKTKQFTITIQNQPGALAGITRPLSAGKVNLVALLATSQGTTATVQLIAENPKKAKRALDEAHITYQETPAEELSLLNKAGALTQILDKLAAKGVNLNALYATAAKGGKRATVVYTAEAQAAQTASA
ncbi:MAG TPA: hypothetical protein VKD65_04445 [Candidatus Angelobacter sp.]|nr:hypothetical protein [Candidatus Angelobacter sp.]